MNKHAAIAALLLLVATTVCAQSTRHGERPSRRQAIRAAIDSMRPHLRRAAAQGRLFVVGDSLLRERWGKSRRDSLHAARALRRLRRYDHLLHAGDSLLEHRYARIAYDTLYITRPTERWLVKLRGNVTGTEVRAKGVRYGETFESNVHSDFRGTLSGVVSYRGLAVGLALNPAKLAGRSNDLELNFTSYGNRFGFDAAYLGSKTLSGSLRTPGGTAALKRGMVKQRALNLNTYYAFNGRRFSFPAAFSQTYRQRRSAGSLMAGASLDAQRIRMRNDTAHATTRLVNVGIGAGYGYNFMMGRHWLLHLSVLPTVSIVNTARADLNGQHRSMPYYFPSIITVERAALVYSWRNRFVSLDGVYTFSSMGSHRSMQVDRGKWRARCSYGFRF